LYFSFWKRNDFSVGKPSGLRWKNNSG